MDKPRDDTGPAANAPGWGWSADGADLLLRTEVRMLPVSRLVHRAGQNQGQATATSLLERHVKCRVDDVEHIATLKVDFSN